MTTFLTFTLVALAAAFTGAVWQRKRDREEIDRWRVSYERAVTDINKHAGELALVRAELARRIANRSEGSKLGAQRRRARMEAAELAREAENRLIEGEQPDLGEGSEEGGDWPPVERTAA